MNTLNNLIIEGNLTNGKREGNAFKFSIVANRFYKGKQLETSFFLMLKHTVYYLLMIVNNNFKKVVESALLEG